MANEATGRSFLRVASRGMGMVRRWRRLGKIEGGDGGRGKCAVLKFEFFVGNTKQATSGLDGSLIRIYEWHVIA